MWKTSVHNESECFDRDRRTDTETDVRMQRQTYRRRDRRTDAETDAQTQRLTCRRRDRWTDAETDVRTQSQTGKDEWIGGRAEEIIDKSQSELQRVVGRYRNCLSACV